MTEMHQKTGLAVAAVCALSCQPQCHHIMQHQKRLPAIRTQRTPPVPARHNLVFLAFLVALIVTCLVAWNMGGADLMGGAKSELHLAQKAYTRGRPTMSVAQMLDMAARLYNYQSDAQQTQVHKQDERVEKAKAEHALRHSPQWMVDDELECLHADRVEAASAMAIQHNIQQLVLMKQLRDGLTAKQRATWSEAPRKLGPGSGGGRQDPIRLGPGNHRHWAAPTRQDHICVVVRTYFAHGPGKGGTRGPLRELLDSLRASTHQAWQVMIVVVDGKPFPGLKEMVAYLNDQRIKIHTMLIGPEHSAYTPDGTPRGYYHHGVFSETDKAIDACNPRTRWFTATNGDNAYDPSFWSEIAKAPESAEVLAFDFYSRFHRLTGRQCRRFESSESPLMCKENLLRVGHTDLAALVFDWKKWRSQNLGYARMPELTNHEKFYGMHDGVAAHHVVAHGWKIHWVEAGSRCLLAHSPNPQLCAMGGGVWDDTHKDANGGKCLSIEEGLDAGVEAAGVELVQIQLAHDPTSFQKPKVRTTAGMAFVPAWTLGTNYTILCLRTVDEVPAAQAMEPTQFHQIATFLDEDETLLANAEHELELVFPPNEGTDNLDTNTINAGTAHFQEYSVLMVVVLVLLIAVVNSGSGSKWRGSSPTSYSATPSTGTGTGRSVARSVAMAFLQTRPSLTHEIPGSPMAVGPRSPGAGTGNKTGAMTGSTSPRTGAGGRTERRSLGDRRLTQAGAQGYEGDRGANQHEQ